MEDTQLVVKWVVVAAIPLELGYAPPPCFKLISMNFMLPVVSMEFRCLVSSSYLSCFITSNESLMYRLHMQGLVSCGVVSMASSSKSSMYMSTTTTDVFQMNSVFCILFKVHIAPCLDSLMALGNFNQC